MINVVAHVMTEPGQREVVLAAFRTAAISARAQNGCIEYAAFVDLPGGPSFQTRCGPDGFVIQERWADMPSLMAHAKMPYMAEFGAKTKGLVVSRAIHLLEAAASQSTPPSP